MGFEDNAVSAADALPRYVDEFGDRFEASYAGPIDRYRPTAHLAVDHGVTVFYAHVSELDEHLLLPLGDDDSDPAEVRRLEAVVRGLAGPNAADVAETLLTHLRTNYDRVERVDASVLRCRCQYAPALGGQPTMLLQAYANPASASLSVGYTPKHTDEPEDLEACVAKNVPTPTVEDYVDRLVYHIDAAIHEERIARPVIEEVGRDALAAHGFRRQTTKPVPESLHPEYGAADAELWQLPASNADWVDGSEGFLRIWRLSDGTGVVDPVTLEGSHEEAVTATTSRVTTAAEPIPE
jgi:hypothetical protein